MRHTLATISGILLIIAAIASLLIMLVGPIVPGGSEAVLALLAIPQSFICDERESIQQNVRTTVTENSVTSNSSFACVDVEGYGRDVTQHVVTFMILSFIVPFMLGIMLIIWGVAGKQRQREIIAVEAIKARFLRGYRPPPSERL